MPLRPKDQYDVLKQSSSEKATNKVAMAKAVISCEKDGPRMKATASTPQRSKPMVTFETA
jgi:hypothetical protein